MSADTQIRKPTASEEPHSGQNDTTSPEAAFDFPDSYDQSTWAETTEPDDDPSITWDTWNVTDKKVYDDLSLSITINASNFLDDRWNFYYDNTADTTCNSSDTFITGTGGNLLSMNPATTNVSVALPADQNLSQLEVCLEGTVSTSGDGGIVRTFDIRTNGSLDTDAPDWRNQDQNTSSIAQGGTVKLAAQGNDTINLSHAVLATNESGAWENKTANYSSPMTLYTENTWTWSNFTWNNASVFYGSAVGWRIWYNDTAGNYNATDITTFSIKVPFLNVTLANPPSPFTATQNDTFMLNATVTCLDGDCGHVTGNASYNGSGTAPDTAIPTTDGETPFHTAQKANPLTCDTELLRDETCNVTWAVNATGADGSVWNVDVNFTTDVGAVQWNDTDNAEVEIAVFAIDIALRWQTIDFGTLFVGEPDNPAENNTDDAYNITVTDSSTENVDLWMNMTDLEQENGDDVIGVSNMSVSIQNDPETESPLSHAFSLLKSNVAPGTNVTTYYWLDTPLGIFADNYTGTMWVKANETA